MSKYIPFRTAKAGYKSDEITDCFMCLEDFSEFDLNYIKCECGEKFCMDCVKYTIEKNINKRFECLQCKKIWNKLE